MKTLANCSPREFLRQTNRIRKAAEKWLDLTGFHALRMTSKENGSDEERRALLRENAAKMLEAMLDKCPDETAELLGLMCFIEPEDLDAHPMTELLSGAAALLDSREVLDFFISLARLGLIGTSTAAGR